MSRLRAGLVREVSLLADPWTAAGVYVLLGGGLMAGIFVPELRLVTGAFGMVVLLAHLRRLDERRDAVDVASVAALLLLAIGVPFSSSPRVSAEFLWFGLVVVACFTLLRRALAEAPRRDRILRVAGRVAAGVAIVVAVLWCWESLQWPLDGAPGPLPPAGLDYSDDWLRNVNVVPIYLALLAPGLVYCWSVSGERLLAGLGLGAAALVTILSASRAAWLGIALGLVVFGLMGLRHRGMTVRGRRAPVALLAAAAFVVLVAAWSGAAQSVLEVAADFATVQSRAAIWNAALASWNAHPVTGAGMGTMPGELLAGGLGALGSSPAPHAHSVPLQILAETGLLGAGALILGLTLVGWHLLATRGASDAGSGAMPWTVRAASAGALVAFAADGLADNHSALAAIDLLVVANVAMLVPTAAGPAGRTRSTTSWRVLRTVVTPVLVIAAVCVAASGLAVVAWGRAQDAIQRGDLAAARQALEVATALDPAFPLYPRELGKILVATGETSPGDALLARGQAGNGNDPNTLRTRGAVALGEGRADMAVSYLHQANALDGGDVTTRLLLGMALDLDDRPAEAEGEYAMAVVILPQLALSDGWETIGVPSARLASVVETALATAEAGPDAWLALRRIELLSVIGEREELRSLLDDSPIPTGASWLAVAEAEAGNGDAARRLLDGSVRDGRRSVAYWTNRAQVMELLGDAAEVDRSYRIAGMLNETARPPSADPGLGAAITRGSNDFWMYQRSTAWFSDTGGQLVPSAAHGTWLRLHAPERIELERLAVVD